jgi:sterigmatocystin biosynthesis cytochrome P450 monooxygenase
MASALLAQRQWAAFGFETDFLTIINPLRYFHIWNNTRIMNRYINGELDKRYSNLEGKSQSKTIIDLALKGYAAEQDAQEKQSQGIDPIFRKYALSQMKVFIFAGHDATASTICYAWLLLSRNPDAMARLKAELDEVLGPDRSKAAQVLSENPALLNKLHYTLAVIKETLRLFPAVSSPRIGAPGFILTDSQGRQFPTEKCLVWANHHGLHRNPLWWPRATEFIPDRFLMGQDGIKTDLADEFHPLKNAWRPFEYGPRACIGTELALTEIKVVLALTVRDFVLEEAYDEWDASHKEKGPKHVNGERVYQVQLGSAHPADGFPARVYFR